MKLVTYQDKTRRYSYRMGFVKDDCIIDLMEACRYMYRQQGNQDQAYIAPSLCPSDPTTFYQQGFRGIQEAQKVANYFQQAELTDYTYRRTEVKLGPPVIQPGKIICIGKNYRNHVKEMQSEIPEYPVLFAKFANALIGPDDEIRKSKQTTKLDYEVELAIVMGRQATAVSEAESLNYIAGYTIANDISARDLQKRTPQWLQGKSLDRSTPIGPWLVTTDEIPDPGKLMIKSSINGEKRQLSNTDQLIFSIPHLISFISSLITLEPGDLILTGTPDGVGFAQSPPSFLERGDIVEMEIEKIGKLSNVVQ
ncbi:fumarylacetoacetate hydrolase family protein [Amphibacillus sediminis]|uniref:fumarylacetoacetate hydrolase family protein n=1 Tax=Amphibacillus sediminis TaxID=360185 RepID=UPI000833BA6B|nr:fumarylacetoacetate hydrolase family protein [Amphibacillus sediminis]